MSLAGGLVFECDVDGTRRRDLNRDRIVRFLRKAPETRLSRSGPQAASNASEAANPTVSDALRRKHLVSLFWTLHRH